MVLYCREQYRQIDLTANRLARYLWGLSGSQNPPRLQRLAARGVSLGLTAQEPVGFEGGIEQ